MSSPQPTQAERDTTRQPLQLYHLSHDLRGPLNSVLGFAELLLEGVEGPLNETQREDVTAIQQSAKTLLNLINTVVDLGKLDAGLLNLHFGPVAIDTIIEPVEKAAAAASNQITVSTNVATPFPTIWGDSDRLRQVVAHITDFILAKKNIHQIIVTAWHTAKDASLQIRTPDIGLSRQQLADLFALTVKIDAAGRSQLTEGGLFLPLAHKLIQAHERQLTVKSMPETGTTFEIGLTPYRANEDKATN